jgi:hypothetical protein
MKPTKNSFLETSYVNGLIDLGYMEVSHISLPNGTYQKMGGGYKIDVYSNDGPTGYVLVTNEGIRGMWSGEDLLIHECGTSEDVYKIMSNNIKWKRKEKIGQILK